MRIEIVKPINWFFVLSIAIILLSRDSNAQNTDTSFSISDFIAPVKLQMDDAYVSDWYKKHSGNKEIELKLLKSRTDFAGNIHYKYKQYYRSLPVEKSMLNIHTNKAGIYALNGNIFPPKGVAASPTLSAEAALQIALARVPADLYAWQDSNMQALLRDAENNESATYYPKPLLCFLPDLKANNVLQPAYRIDIYSLRPLQKNRVFINAVNGQLLSEENLLHSIDRTGTAHTLFSGVKSIVCDSVSPTQFYLTETKRGGGIATYNAQKTFSSITIKFLDDDNVWNNVNADRDEAATDLHWGMEMTYDYYKDILLRNSYDDKGHKIIAMAHAGVKYNNAQFDGTLAFFGDGDDIVDNPWVSLDMCGHEITHGLTKETADLFYQDEMGALNESFSDIFGKCIEYYHGASPFNWKVGDAIRKSGTGIRNMQDPNATNHPRYYHGKYYYTGTIDFGGVHTNSNVQNFWFYLLCEGGVGTRESDGGAYTVKAIGLAKAEQIAYSNLVDYLFPLAQYKDAATYSIQAAKALYGISSDEYKQVEEAWYAVGVINKPTDIKELHEANEMSAYPNPAKDKVRIEFGTFLTEGSIKLYDLTGRQLLSTDAVKGNGLDMDINHLQSGFYWLAIRTGDVCSIIKLVKL
ncbi:MAG: M4 family metallopeptidase [Chitinophagaceae bacterium]|jgi:Zn-dependent metalloprotease